MVAPQQRYAGPQPSAMAWYDTRDLYANNPYMRATLAPQDPATGDSWAMRALTSGTQNAPAGTSWLDQATTTAADATRAATQAAQNAAPAPAAPAPVVTAAQQNAQQNAQSPAPQTQAITSTTLPGWAKSTSGRTGKSYSAFLAANPGFDPYTNLDAYAGAGGSQSPALQQAFGWLNEWARNNGYQDGKNIPQAQRAQMFLAFVERARQGMADRGENWQADAASRIPNAGWAYTAGWGLTHGGQSYETQGPGATGGGTPATTPATTPTTAPATAPATTTTPATGGAPVAGSGHFDPSTGQWVPDNAPAAGEALPQGAFYQANPQVAVTNFLAAHGITPETHSRFGDMLRKLGAGLAPVLAQTLGMGSGAAGAMDQLTNLPAMLTNLIYGGGGQTFGNIGNYANSVLGNVQGTGPGGTSFLSGMDPGAVENLLKTITGLRGLGLNQYMQNYQQNALQATLDRYGQADLATGGTANAGDWYTANDPYGLFRFAGAGGGLGTTAAGGIGGTAR